ncbi:DUF2285 domain-containing protein [Bosea sp. CRIB-10]|uniref:DUF2285 domain-containing protein n=1 Tax=Bosea sp. CRIB-10 TaxID=378404 RepID=UPI000B889406|nr:DUF2285 domain-containing protein [Bosea sp. CRIB-10]
MKDRETPNLIAGATSHSDGSFVAYDLGGGQRLQLEHLGDKRQATAVAALVLLDRDGFARLESIHRLLAALFGRSVPPDTRLTPQQRLRYRRMLQAIDGYRHGATQQEIAQALLRTPLLGRDEWQASSARHSIKTLLRDARSLIAGGYRKLLRHRRRP